MIKIEGPTAELRSKVWFDLLTICRDAVEMMTYDDTTGKVEFLGRPPDDTPSVLCGAFATDYPYDIVITPATIDTQMIDPWPPKAVVPLCSRGVGVWPTGFNAVAGYSVLTRIDITYDATDYGVSQNGWLGYRGYDASGHELPIGAQHLLAFGLGSAFQIWKQLREMYADSTTPYTVDAEVSLAYENFVRRAGVPTPRVGPLELYLPRCPALPGKRPGPSPEEEETPKEKKPKETFHWFGNPNCFVATAALGSDLAPELQRLREFRTMLMSTRWGASWFDRFYSRYYELSPPLADRMRNDSELARLLRVGIVQPYVNWLELAMRMPDAPLDGLPAEWRDFLATLMDRLDAWSAALGMPSNFEGLEPLDVVRELAIVLRYGIRDPERRSTYLHQLTIDGVLPLSLSGRQAKLAREMLRSSGVSTTYIDRVVDASEGMRTP